MPGFAVAPPGRLAGMGPGRRLSGTAAVTFVLAAILAGCAADPPPTAAEGVRTIGFLRAVRSPEPQNVRILVAEMEAAGLMEGRNLRVHGADPGEVHADPAEAEAVVRGWATDGLDLVVALSSTGAMAAARGAPNANVLFLSNDPSAVGLVKDERRPEGRLTGATFRVPADRTLDLARRVVPGLTKVGFLYPSTDPTAPPARDAMARAARGLGIEVVARSFASTEEIGGAVEALVAEGIGCLLLANAPATTRNYPAITDALAAHPVPVVTNTTADFAVLVLEPDTAELYRQLGRQAARLLKGAAPSEVPVEDPAGFRSTLNARVADQFGLELSADLLRTVTTVVGR